MTRVAVFLCGLLTACASVSAVPKAPPSPIADVELIRGTAIDAPLLLAVHGRGGRPESFSTVFNHFEGDLRVACPRAEHPFSQGFTWFTVGVRGGDTPRLAREITAASKRLAALLNGWSRSHPGAKKPMITGFSQGGMLAFAVAVQHPESVSLAVPLSGWLPRSLWPGEAPPNAPVIHALHGEDDTVLPFAATSAGVTALQARGWHARLSIYEGVGHRLTRPMREELYREIRRGLTQSGAQDKARRSR